MPNKPVPSLKRLEAAFPGKGAEIRALLKGEKKTREYKSVQELMARCYHKPDYAYRLGTALNEILDGFGWEALHKEGNPSGDPIAEYVNLGDTYTTTLVRKCDTGTVMITDWGSFAESNRL